MKTFQEFMSICEEVEDKSKALGFQATIRRARPGGRIGAERKKTTPERRRMRAVGGGKMEPVEYKPRKDIGKPKGSQTQEPEQERGSARERQLAAAKEERRKAAQARAAAKKGGESATAAKPKAKEVEKTATKLLSKKKEEKPVSPDYKPGAGKPKGTYTRSERQRLMRQGERELEKRVREAEAEKQKKKPSDVKLKNFSRTWATNK